MSGRRHASRFSPRASSAAPPVAGQSPRNRGTSRPADWRAGLPCCARGTEDRGSPRARDCSSPSAGRRPLSWLSILKRIWQSRSSARSSTPGKPSPPAEPFDLLRRCQRGRRCCNRRIANPEQRAGARQFQDHVVGAPPQIGEARQDEHVGVTQLRHARPIIRHLRLDDDQVRSLRPRPRPGRTRRYSRRPCAANRRTRRSTSLSTVLRGEAKTRAADPCAVHARARLRLS